MGTGSLGLRGLSQERNSISVSPGSYMYSPAFAHINLKQGLESGLRTPILTVTLAGDGHTSGCYGGGG